MITNFNEFINEDVVLLRTMTLKSIFNFGKYNGLSVQQVLDLRKTAYLRFIYYTIEGINFVDEILKMIGVIGIDFDYRIKKPGKNSELLQKIFKEKQKYFNDDINDYLNKTKLAKKIRFDNLDKRTFSKKSLQAWNQGKK